MLTISPECIGILIGTICLGDGKVKVWCTGVQEEGSKVYVNECWLFLDIAFYKHFLLTKSNVKFEPLFCYWFYDW